MDTKNAELTLIEISARYGTEEAARQYFEKLRWPNGPTCPHCGNANQDRIYKVTENKATKIRSGLYKCAECRESFTVTIGTVMEDTHLPLHKWLMAFYMMCASKTQVSALQLQRQLEIGSYRSAWFMCHRIRYALKEHEPTDLLNGVVEADETYIGGKVKGKGRRYTGNKTAVVSLVERKGRVRSTVVDKVSGSEISKILKKHVNETAHLNTDESPIYKKVGKKFSSHETVNHNQDEYVRHNNSGQIITTNTAEGFFGNSKRSIDGAHHHISRKHTELYFAELDFKYNTRKITDGARTVDGILKIEGKRLMYRKPKMDDKNG